MTLFTYALGCYFAAVVGVAGLAKLADPVSFAATLRRFRLIPGWSVACVGRLMPIGEIALAGLLVSGLARRQVAFATALLFVGFLGAKLFLLMARHETTCGCFGSADADRLDYANIGTAAILVALALAHLRLVNTTAPPPSVLPASASVVFTLVGGLLGTRTWQRSVAARHLNASPVVWLSPR